MGFRRGRGHEELVQLLFVPFDEIVGQRDKLGFELIGGLEEFVFRVCGAFAAFGAAAAEEVLVVELSLADAEGVAGVDIFDEELVPFLDRFEGAEQELRLVEEDNEVGIAAVVCTTDNIVEAYAERNIV